MPTTRPRLLLRLFALAVSISLATGACESKSGDGGEGKPMSAQHIAGPAGSLFVDDDGKADSIPLPVVFVHSFGGNTAHWSAQLDHLRPTRRALALDLRGHGQSEAPSDSDYTIEAMARDIAAVVDAKGARRFVLVGHSQGAAAALEYAAGHPQQVAGLLLVDPPVDPAGLPPEVKKQLDDYIAGVQTAAIDSVSEGYLRYIAGQNGEVVERLLKDLRATPRATVREGGAKSLGRYDPKPALSRLRGPVKAIVTTPNDTPISLHRIGKGFPHEVITGTGHWLHLDRPEEFNRMLDQFLATVR